MVTASNIYIFSPPASGKTTFATCNPVYSGYKIVDFAQELPNRSLLTKSLGHLSRAAPFLRSAVYKRKDMIALDEDHYFQYVEDFIAHRSEPVAILGRRPPRHILDSAAFESMKVALVIIPESNHRKNCEARRRKHNNRLPFFQHRTTVFSNIQDAREKNSAYASRNGIRIFDSFEAAITTLARAGSRVNPI
jgi:hypothetical protein